MRPLILVFVVSILLAGAQAGTDERVQMEDVLDFELRGIQSIEFAPATRKLFVSYSAKPNARHADSLYQWDLSARKIEHVYRLGEGYVCLELMSSPNGRFLVASCLAPDGAGEQLFLIDSEKREVIDLHQTESIYEMWFSREGDRFAVVPVVSSDPVKVFDTSGQKVEGEELTQFPRVENPDLKYYWPAKGDSRSGLYSRDRAGRGRWLDISLLGQKCYAATANGFYIGVVLNNQELVVLSHADLKPIYRRCGDESHGFISYDAAENRFLFTEFAKGSAKLRALRMDAPASEN